LTRAAWNWLPDEALVAPDVLQRLDETLQVWSHRWFPRHVLTRRRTMFGTRQATAVAASTDCVSVRMDVAAVQALGGEAIAADLGRLELTEGDRRVVDGFCQALLEDLVRSLDAALPGAADADPPPPGSGPVAFELAAEDGRSVGVIETSRAVLAAARLAGMRPSTRPRPELNRLRAAVGELPVRLSVRLGSAAVAVPEARRLTAGDVVILDRALDQPLEIVSAAPEAVVACARMTDGTSPCFLRLEPA